MTKRMIAALKIAKYQEIFLEMNGCIVLAKWLSPMPDGCFPHSKILTSVLSCIADMDIETEHLETFALGKAVMAVAEGAESVQIRKKAKALVDKWSRQIYGINTSWAAMETPEAPENSVAENNLHRLIQNDVNPGAVRLPAKNQFDFRYRPKSKAAELAHTPNPPKFLSKAVRKPRARKLASAMSADGRNLATE